MGRAVSSSPLTSQTQKLEALGSLCCWGLKGRRGAQGNMGTPQPAPGVWQGAGNGAQHPWLTALPDYKDGN